MDFLDDLFDVHTASAEHAVGAKKLKTDIIAAPGTCQMPGPCQSMSSSPCQVCQSARRSMSGRNPIQVVGDPIQEFIDRQTATTCKVAGTRDLFALQGLQLGIKIKTMLFRGRSEESEDAEMHLQCPIHHFYPDLSTVMHRRLTCLPAARRARPSAPLGDVQAFKTTRVGAWLYLIGVRH